MDIQIPSPSVFLRASPNPTTLANPPPPRKPVKPRGANKKKLTTDAAVTKPKQSKSRNGCMTCKKKRLKCDEIKPSCQQCQKRNVLCEGYKKDYKWRSFEETTFNSRTVPKKKAQTYSSRGGRWSPGLESAFASASQAFQDAPTSIPAIASPSDEPLPELPSHMHIPELDTTFVPVSLELPSPGSSFDLDTPPLPVMQEYATSKSSRSFSSGSPQLPNFDTPVVDPIQQQDTSNSNSTISPPESPLKYHRRHDQYDIQESHEEADEEIVREINLAKDSRAWQDRQSSPALSDDSTSSRSSELTILPSPDFDMSSPEMLMVRFDRYTCGILSVKDGPTENPWRTLIWPLAKDSEALYHAISSMTAFHGAHEVGKLRVAGMGHMTKSIRKLASDIENMRLDAALATSLALALSEGWDEKTSTGIQHLRGAKIMVNGAMVKHQKDVEQGRLTAQDAIRLKFLCNTFIYLDVIARLTSNEEAQDLNFEDILFTANPPQGDLVEVDPLMGCATTLFPIIGRVANLIQRVRKMDRNSLAIVSQAMELKQQLLQWDTPDYFSFEAPEDPSSEVQHSIQTAEAYRYATLLYLHQAVPEIPTDSSEILSKRVLVFLASVPLSSRTTIIQIFPLFAASCEAVTQDDRQWVTERWSAMTSRLRIGNVESCWKVVKEVWQRRDTFEAEKAQRLMRRYTSRGLSTGNLMSEVPTLTRRTTTSEIPFDQIEPEYTIRGNLHWLGVMSDWNWEDDDLWLSLRFERSFQRNSGDVSPLRSYTARYAFMLRVYSARPAFWGALTTVLLLMSMAVIAIYDFWLQGFFPARRWACRKID